MKTFRKLTILSLALLVFSCKKDADEIVNTKPENKINFQTVYPTLSYNVNINPNATMPYDLSDNDRLVLTNSVLSVEHGNFVWILKPVSNNHWSIKPTTTVKTKWDSHGYTTGVYKLDQILLPSDSQGASSVFPTESLNTALNNPLKISVEFWQSEVVFPMVAASAIDQGEPYTKQTKQAKKLETKELTLNAENFALVLPTSVTKGQVLDLKTFLHSSVKTTGENSPVFIINDVTLNGSNYTVPSTGTKLKVHVQKKYANGVFLVTGEVNVI